MAIGIHVAKVAFLPVNRITGLVVDKNAAATKVSDVLQTEHQHVILPDSAIPNAAGYPTIEEYLEAEAASDFVLYHMSQNMIVTYDAGAINAAV